MQAALAGRGYLRGALMRTAILSVFLAVISAAASPQDPAKPISEALPNQQKPPDQQLSVLCAPGTTIQLGVAYNSTVVASGGTGAYRFAITGGALPGGLALNSATGTISGTPTADGTFSYTVQVTDSAGGIATTGGTPCAMQLPAAPARAAAQAAAPRPGARGGRRSRYPTCGRSRPGKQAAGGRAAGDRPRETGSAAGQSHRQGRAGASPGRSSLHSGRQGSDLGSGLRQRRFQRPAHDPSRRQDHHAVHRRRPGRRIGAFGTQHFR